MNDAAWWARVVQARTERDDLRPQRVWTLHKGGHAAAIDLKAVPGIGAEIVLTVDGELRKTGLFRSHEQAELVRSDRGHAEPTLSRVHGRHRVEGEVWQRRIRSTAWQRFLRSLSDAGHGWRDGSRVGSRIWMGRTARDTVQTARLRHRCTDMDGTVH